jgi:ATP-dependent Clp protease adaptor protein ClpS
MENGSSKKNLNARLKGLDNKFVLMWQQENDMKPMQEQDTDTLVSAMNPYSLIVWNDEVNTFEWVIETLIEICDHTPEQAEQCALFIHYQGKYAVKQGEYDTLKPMCDAITERGIGATIEVMAE